MTPHELYIARRDRTAHPSGNFDHDAVRRWYPSDTEECDCCRSVRRPSRAYPYSLMVHCRTAVHIAQLCNVPVSEVLHGTKTDPWDAVRAVVYLTKRMAWRWADTARPCSVDHPSYVRRVRGALR